MEPDLAIEIVQKLADGVAPFTDERLGIQGYSGGVFRVRVPRKAQ